MTPLNLRGLARTTHSEVLQNSLHLTPVAAGTTWHRLSGFKHYKSDLLQAGGQKSEISVTGLRSRCQQGRPLGSSRGTLFLAFSCSQKPLSPMAHGPFLASLQPLVPASHLLLLTLTFLLPS